MADQQEESNIRQEYNSASTGLDMDHTSGQIPKGKWTYSLNGAVENFDSNGITLQNEPGNEFCVQFPEGYRLIGHHLIGELTKFIFFLTNPDTGDSQIGYMDNNDCIYHTLINSPCLNFNILHPVHKCVHKITNCTTEIYWTDGFNPRRYLDINNIPKVLFAGTPLCSPIYTDNLDCNQLKLQPNFTIPLLSIKDVLNVGNLITGTYQFAVQYSDAAGNPYSSYYSVTNPIPIFDPQIVTPNFNYPVGKSIVINVTNLDLTGKFQYFNLAVIKTINAIPSVELVGIYSIETDNKQITYTGEDVSVIHLTIDDIFEKFPFYDIAQDVTTVNDILIWDQLSSIDRINYQQIWSEVTLQWESWRIPATESYSDEMNALNFRSYLRDEVYAFEGVFLLSNGKETDGFHIPGRIMNLNEINTPDIPETNEDFVGAPTYYAGSIGYSPYWKIYNTASVKGVSLEYTSSPSYKGPYQYGDFAYWEAAEEYPCNQDVWGSLAGQKIRHHKFPDVLVSPIFESKIFTDQYNMVMGNDAIFPIGVKIDINQIKSLIASSNLSKDEKDAIVGFKIVRGDRGTNKSIVAKGILRNVGVYNRDDKDYYYPNYPYNDLNADPFLTSTNSAYLDQCQSFDINITALAFDPNGGPNYAEIEYSGCNTNKTSYQKYYSIGLQSICSIGKPKFKHGVGTVTYINYDYYYIASIANLGGGGCKIQYEDITEGIKTIWLNGWPNNDHTHIKVVIGTIPSCIDGNCAKSNITLISTYIDTSSCGGINPLPPITDKYRQIFNSPETSFGQPFLGSILKLECVIFGGGKAHFTEVKKNSQYRLITEELQKAALDTACGMDGVRAYPDSGGHIVPFNTTALFTAYQSYLTIYTAEVPRRNYAYSFNSIADYNYTNSIPNDLGIKQRNLDITKYLIPSVIYTGDTNDINNYQRETSVFLRTDLTKTSLPFPDSSPNMLSGAIPIIKDYSRFTISQEGNCDDPAREKSIRSVVYYASMKNEIVDQWGQLYSYETIDTGFSRIFNAPSTYNTVFGGDTFISRFAFKTKIPFFIDNRVGAPDDSDVFYDELGNVGYPTYWHSARSILKNYHISDLFVLGTPIDLANIISYKAHNFDCPNFGVSLTTTTPSGTTTSTTTVVPYPILDITSSNIHPYYDGYFYLFAYGIPNFYCESSYNTDLRKAFNNREGDFWPHVTSHIPDDWTQESFVSIANDNTYTYNTTYSKQNKEDVISHLPSDWKNKLCYTHYPFRAIYSNFQEDYADNKVNAWLAYRANSFFDFPQNYGKLTSLDGIQNKAILARFENKSLLYNTLITIDTSNPKAAYIGNDKLFRSSPPIDFAETDLGYMGSQNKLLLKIPQGQVTVDAKRGQIFLITGQEVVELSTFGCGLNRFFTDHLAFEALRYFPTLDTDNHFNGMGLHGVYDSKYDRIIITKLDYVPKRDDIKYDSETGEFYYEEIVPIPEYDCTIEGDATSTGDCRLVGTAIDFITTTTTSTLPSSTTTTTTECNTCFGLYYNWYTLQGVDNNSIAAAGWHPSTWTEWNDIFTYYGGTMKCGCALIDPCKWTNYDDFGSITNESKLSLGNTGERSANGTFILHKYEQYYAASDEYDVTRQKSCYIYGCCCEVYNNYVSGFNNKKAGLPVRLVKDSTVLSHGQTGIYIGNDGTIYNTICINGVEWLSEDLYETQLRSGISIPEVTDNTTWSLLETAAMCVQSNNWGYCCRQQPSTTTTTTTHSGGAETITIGDGNIACNYPYTTYWMGGRSQFLYLAEDLTAAGAFPGTITSIGFNVYSADLSTMHDFNIHLGNTTEDVLTGWNTTIMQNCYSGEYAVPGTGWQFITLDIPFFYNGSNLVVEVCFTNTGYGAYSYIYGTTATTGQVSSYWQDNIIGCSVTNPPYSNTGLPNLRFIEQ